MKKINIPLRNDSKGIQITYHNMIWNRINIFITVVLYTTCIISIIYMIYYLVHKGWIF